MFSRTAPVRARALIAGLALAIAAGVLAPVPAAAAPAQTPTTRAGAPDPQEGDPALQAQYDEVLGQEGELVGKLLDAGKRRQELQDRLATLQQQLAESSARLQQAERELAAATASQQRAARELADAVRRVERARSELQAQAVSSYIHGGLDSREALVVTLDHPDRAGRSRTYASAVVDHQHDLVLELRSARQARTRAARAADEARAAAAARRDDVATVQKGLEDDQARTAAVSDETDRELFMETALLTQLQAKKVDIEARITAEQHDSDSIALLLAARQQGQPDWVPGTITFTAPIPGARLTSPFGYRVHPILGYRRLHTGADIGAPIGTPIHAAADGVVVLAEVRGGYGNCTVIDHGQGIATLYGHQSQLAVQPGQVVKAGDVIGYVGSTGLSTGPHLHFETRVRGVPVDPTSFVALT